MKVRVVRNEYDEQWTSSEWFEATEEEVKVLQLKFNVEVTKDKDDFMREARVVEARILKQKAEYERRNAAKIAKAQEAALKRKMKKLEELKKELESNG